MLGLAGIIILHLVMLVLGKHLRTYAYLEYLVVGLISLSIVGVIVYYMMTLEITPRQLNEIEKIF